MASHRGRRCAPAQWDSTTSAPPTQGRGRPFPHPSISARGGRAFRIARGRKRAGQRRPEGQFGFGAGRVPRSWNQRRQRPVRTLPALLVQVDAQPKTVARDDRPRSMATAAPAKKPRRRSDRRQSLRHDWGETHGKSQSGTRRTRISMLECRLSARADYTRIRRRWRVRRQAAWRSRRRMVQAP